MHLYKYEKELEWEHNYTYLRRYWKILFKKSQQKPDSTKAEFQCLQAPRPKEGNVSYSTVASLSHVNAVPEALAAKLTAIMALTQVPMVSHWPPTVQHELMHLHKQHDL